MKTYNGNIVQREEGDFYAEVWVGGNLLSYPLSKPVVEAKGNVDFQLIEGKAVVVGYVNYKIEEYLFDWIGGDYNPPFNTDDLVQFAAYCLKQRDKESLANLTNTSQKICLKDLEDYVGQDSSLWNRLEQLVKERLK
jgi:hypothetical protein